MPTTGTRRGNLIYHWKHGFIPLDHYAALKKAHGSEKGAARVMARHGIGGGGHSGGHGSEHTHPVGAAVAARQPGIEKQTHGKVVGHDSNGMLKVQYQDRKGNPVVGTFNPAHTQVTATTGRSEPHPAPHTLNPGDHATVRGIDHMGQPATFTGKVMSNGEVSSFAKGRTTGGQPLRSIGIERQDGSKRTNVVYVPDPNRGEQKRQTNSQGLAAARAETQRSQEAHLRAGAVAHGLKKPQPSAGDLSDAAAQWKRENPGKTIAGHEREVSRIADRLAERKFVDKNTTGDTAAQHAAERARIKAAMASPQTTIKRLAAEKAGTSRPVGVMGRPSALDSMPSVAPRNAQMRGEHVVTAKEAAANRAAMKATSKRAEDTLKAAQKDSTGKELLAVAKQGQGTSARAAIVRAAEDVGQGNHESARKRLETALADTRAMGPAYPGDKTHTADTRALNNALKVLGGDGKPKADPAASLSGAKSEVANARAKHGVGSPEHMAALGKLGRAQHVAQKGATAPKIDLQSNVNSQAEIATAARRQSLARLKKSDAARIRAMRKATGR